MADTSNDGYGSNVSHHSAWNSGAQGAVEPRVRLGGPTHPTDDRQIPSHPDDGQRTAFADLLPLIQGPVNVLIVGAFDSGQGFAWAPWRVCGNASHGGACNILSHWCTSLG